MKLRGKKFPLPQFSIISNCALALSCCLLFNSLFEIMPNRYISCASLVMIKRWFSKDYFHFLALKRTPSYDSCNGMFYILSKDLQFLEFSAVNPQRSTDCRPVTKRHGNSCVTKLSIASLFSEKKLKHLGYCHDMFRFQSRKSWSVGQQRKKKACIVVFTGTDTVCLLQFLCHFSTQVETEVGR